MLIVKVINVTYVNKELICKRFAYISQIGATRSLRPCTLIFGPAYKYSPLYFYSLYITLFVELRTSRLISHSCNSFSNKYLEFNIYLLFTVCVWYNLLYDNNKKSSAYFFLFTYTVKFYYIFRVNFAIGLILKNSFCHRRNKV